MFTPYLRKKGIKNHFSAKPFSMDHIKSRTFLYFTNLDWSKLFDRGNYRDKDHRDKVWSTWNRFKLDHKQEMKRSGSKFRLNLTNSYPNLSHFIQFLTTQVTQNQQPSISTPNRSNASHYNKHKVLCPFRQPPAVKSQNSVAIQISKTTEKLKTFLREDLIV